MAIRRDERGAWQDQFPERQVINRAGFRRLGERQGEVQDFAFLEEAWDAMCGEGNASPTEVAKTLRRAGYLIPGEGKNLARKVRLPGLGIPRCYVVKPDIFSGGSDSDPRPASAEQGEGDD